MTKWKYQVLKLLLLSDNTPLLNKLGIDGWELVSVSDDTAYFKKPIKDEIAKIYENKLKADLEYKKGYDD